MLNSKPNKNKNYHQGNFIPKNKDKVLKLNSEGGLYYRSGLEQKIMIWLDNKENIIQWGAECLEIPYQRTHIIKGEKKLKSHRYYPDFFYIIESDDGARKYVVVEAKSMKEYKNVILLKEKKMEVPKSGHKKLKNFEYDLKEAHKNMAKWEQMIKWCDKKGYEFIIITEQHLKKLINQ